MNYKDRDWLHNEYINNQKSTIKIAKEQGVSHKTISRWIHKLGIEMRHPHDSLLLNSKHRKSKAHTALEYYMNKEARTTLKSKPTLNWKRGK